MGRIVNKATAVRVADSRLIRAMPKIVKHLVTQEDTDGSLDKMQLEFYTKLLPGALERHFASNAVQVHIDPTVSAAIGQLASSFSPETANLANPEADSTSNTESATEEALDSVTGLDNPKGDELDRTNLLADLLPSELVSGSHRNLDKVTTTKRPYPTRALAGHAHDSGQDSSEGRSRVTRRVKGSPTGKATNSKVTEV